MYFQPGRPRAISFGGERKELGLDESKHDTAGAWAKRYYFASRTMIEAILRPYGLGSTQWYVLHQLANDGPTNQRELGSSLQIEKPTLTEVANVLVRKGLVKRLVDPADQRQRILELTAAGRDLWAALPDPIGFIQAIAFEGIDDDDLLTIKTVLRTATERITQHTRKDSSK